MMIVIKWCLIILGILLAAAVLIVTAVLWSTVTFDAAANKSRAILTVSMWHFIRRTFEIPSDKLGDIGEEIKKEAADETADELEDAADDEADSKKNRFFGSFDTGDFKTDLKNLWDSENYVFDFQALHDMIIKYAGIIADYKYGLGRVLGHMKYKIRLDRLDIYIRYGTGEPDKTGMAYGAMYAGAGTLTPLIKQYIKTDTGIRLFLDPDYVNKVFDFEVGAVFKTRLAHVLNALIVGTVSYLLRKRKRSRL